MKIGINDIDEKYLKYARDVLSDKIVACKYIKLACQRYLDFFDKYDFKPNKVDKVINFISKLKHYEGKHARQNFILEEYQKFFIYHIFGFYKKNSDERVTRYIYAELARKSGKSALVAAICLYMLIADGEAGAEIELVANSAKQAKIMFDKCSKYLRSIDPRDKYFNRYRDSIKFEKNDALLQILSSDSGNNDGYNSYCFALDEAHEQRDSKLWDVMLSSQGMRKNPLAIIITTAGFSQFGFCYQYRKTCIEILNKLKTNDAQFIAIYTLDDNDDYKNEDVWGKANPTLDVTVSKNYLREMVKQAENNSALETGILTKNFNVWCNSLETWISTNDIIEVSEKLNLEDFKNCFAYVGIDLAAVSDLTSVTYLILKDEIFYFYTDYYLPEDCLKSNSNSVYYQHLKNQKFLKVTPDNATDYDFILRDILKMREILFIEKVAYDSYNATQFAINAEAAGLPLEPYSQSLSSFNKPTKELERLIKTKNNIVIDDNEITRWCFDNVSLKYDYNENVKPVKSSKQQKIDGVISIIEALGCYLEIPHYDNKIY